MKIHSIGFFSSSIFRILHFTNIHILRWKINKSESITFLWDTEFLFYHPLGIQEEKIDKYLPVNRMFIIEHRVSHKNTGDKLGKIVIRILQNSWFYFRSFYVTSFISYLSIYLSICLSVFLNACSLAHPSALLSVCPYVHLSALCLFVRPSVRSSTTFVNKVPRLVQYIGVGKSCEVLGKVFLLQCWFRNCMDTVCICTYIVYSYLHLFLFIYISLSVFRSVRLSM
jgi:hypothetical protein